ncbi:MAG: helix-turn-helix transcriptional regulator [Clostridia bacterium]|nr:helix-turn-helix transcriptional regulator [Clostridia bacterium]
MKKIAVYEISIAKKIKNYRDANALSQRAFGKLLGVSAQAVCKWESGMCYPDITLLPALSSLLGCLIDDFFTQA